MNVLLEDLHTKVDTLGEGIIVLQKGQKEHDGQFKEVNRQLGEINAKLDKKVDRAEFEIRVSALEKA